MPNLILYVSEYCWFCKKVEAFMQENNISLEKRDTMENPNFRQELLEVGGKTQVPCLFIDGKPLYESDDIIDYMKDTLL